jgi:hypothetical protein
MSSSHTSTLTKNEAVNLEESIEIAHSGCLRNPTATAADGVEKSGYKNISINSLDKQPNRTDFINIIAIMKSQIISLFLLFASVSAFQTYSPIVRPFTVRCNLKLVALIRFNVTTLLIEKGTIICATIHLSNLYQFILHGILTFN